MLVKTSLAAKLPECGEIKLRMFSEELEQALSLKLVNNNNAGTSVCR